LVRSKRTLKQIALLVVVAALAACGEAPTQPPAARKLPQIEATVVTLRTTVTGSDRAVIHRVVASDGKARIGNELDRWRLFDFTNKTVTFVDEVERSFRTETFDAVLATRRTATSKALPGQLPRARVESSQETRTIAGVPGQRHSILLGAYRRDLWLSREPVVDPMFFTILSATEPIEAEFAGIMRDAYPRLAALRGFPLLDRSELPVGAELVIAERIVEKIEQTSIPAVWLQIPEGYEDKTPTAPAGNRQNGGSPRSGRNARGAE
jgi:hypothetical protein